MRNNIRLPRKKKKALKMLIETGDWPRRKSKRFYNISRTDLFNEYHLYSCLASNQDLFKKRRNFGPKECKRTSKIIMRK